MGSGASAGKIVLEYDENRGNTRGFGPWDEPWTPNTEYLIELNFTSTWHVDEDDQTYCLTEDASVPNQLPEDIPPYGEGEWVCTEPLFIGVLDVGIVWCVTELP